MNDVQVKEVRGPEPFTPPKEEVVTPLFKVENVEEPQGRRKRNAKTKAVVYDDIAYRLQLQMMGIEGYESESLEGKIMEDGNFHPNTNSRKPIKRRKESRITTTRQALAGRKRSQEFA
jgi:hypothetical protein